jgi:amino acid transporter
LFRIDAKHSMSSSDGIKPPSSSGSHRAARAAKVIIVGSVMFTFISFWRTAAVVLCDLASTAYYIGGIVEQAIGPAAPWFILAVMLFSYAVRSVYIESCSLFVRGGVYRVVKEAMGGFLAKISVSALIFDYTLTGPISGASAGAYIMGLLFDTIKILSPDLYASMGLPDADYRRLCSQWGSVVIACGITLYFFWQNIKGIHESSGKALKIMIVTTVMAIIMIAWCCITLAVQGVAKYEDPPGVVHVNEVPMKPDLSPKMEEKDGKLVPKLNPVTGRQEDPLGFLRDWGPANQLRDPNLNWWSVIGVIGLLVAFGHSILAMSGEETLAQVYREIESPKLVNFKKAAFIVFVYSLVLTAGISFLAVLLIPANVRIADYADNLIGGLAMNVAAPAAIRDQVRLGLNAFVVIVGFLILAGAVNTAIIGSNGVLNRVAEDGVMPDWFLRPHPRFGTTYRLLYLIVALQLFTIIASRGDMYLLGEAYAFGVVWSFVFKALAMVVLRFKEPGPREAKVPLNIHIGKYEVPIGLTLIFLILLLTAIVNFFTKEVATVGGVIFTVAFLVIFMASEHYHEKKRRGGHHQHLEQFNQQTTEEISPAALRLRHPYRKLVAIRSPQNLFMLEKTLAETDPETTDVIILTAKVSPPGGVSLPTQQLDEDEQKLMTAVVTLAEKAGKEVSPLIVPTNNPLFAVVQTAKDLAVQEIVMGASNKYTADTQLEQIAFYWLSIWGGNPTPLTIRILSRDRDMFLDLAGGNRIPKISERKARTVAELRAAGVGIDRVLLVYDGSPAGSDLFQGVLTMLDPAVALALVPLVPPGASPHNGHHLIQQDQERARQLGREMHVHEVTGDPGPAIVKLAQDQHYDAIIVLLPPDPPDDEVLSLTPWANYILHHAHCQVFLTMPPPIPDEVIDQTKPAGEAGEPAA